MAVVTSEIRQDGLGDYTTLAAFEAATDLNSGADIWDGWCSQAGDSFDESFTFNVDGTSATSHVRLRGPAVGTKATINYTGAATQAVLVTTADWLDLEDLIIARSGGGPGTSDEGIRFSGSAENVKISRCIFWTPLDVTQMDGIYIAAGTYSISIDNSLFYGWDRAGIHEQSLSGGSSVTLNLDHNTGVFCGAGGAGNEQAPLSIRNNSSGNVTVVNGYNNVWKSHDNSSDGTSYADIFVRSGSGSTVTFNGSHDCMDDLSTLTDGLTTDNRTNLVSATAGVVETDTASAVIITETTRDATFDATPQALANNVIIGAGTNRIGSEPDPRQDFSVDLWGNARPTTNVDIGAIQVSTGGGGGPVTFSGSATESASTSASGSLATRFSGSATEPADSSASGSLAASFSASATESGSTAAAGSQLTRLSGSATESASSSATGTHTGAPVTFSASATESASSSATGSQTTVLSASATESASSSATGSVVTSFSASAIESASSSATGSMATALSASATESAASSATGSQLTRFSASATESASSSATGTLAGAPVTFSGSATESASSSATGAQEARLEGTAATESASSSASGSQVTRFSASATESASSSATGQSSTPATTFSATATESASSSALGAHLARLAASQTISAISTATGSHLTRFSGSATESASSSASGSIAGAVTIVRPWSTHRLAGVRRSHRLIGVRGPSVRASG